MRRLVGSLINVPEYWGLYKNKSSLILNGLTLQTVHMKRIKGTYLGIFFPKDNEVTSCVHNVTAHINMIIIGNFKKILIIKTKVFPNK